MASPYEIAKQHGYSDEEINSFLGERDPRYARAIEAGYSPEEITTFLSKKSEPQEGLAENIGRQVGRSGARVAETVLGAPRAFGDFLEGLVPEERIKNLAEKVGLRKPVEKGFEFRKKFAPHKLLPKSEDIRKNVTKFIFGEKLEPKNKWEEKADSLISDFAALAIPLPGNQLKLLKPALLALGGNAVAEGVGWAGGTEKQKTYAKIGTILAGSMINPKSAETLKKQLYDEARSLRAPDAKVDAFKLQNNVKKYRQDLQKGGSAPYKTAALKKLDELEEAAKSGDIGVEELEKFKISINTLRGALYEEFKGNKAGRKLAKASLDRVSNIVDKGLDVYGFANPEWLSVYRQANEVHGAIAQSSRARNFIARTAKKYGVHGILPALGIGHAVGIPGVVGMAGTAAAGTAAVMGGEIIAKFAKSPTLRKHYMDLINSAMKEDAILVHKNLEKLKKELEKSNKESDLSSQSKR